MACANCPQGPIEVEVDSVVLQENTVRVPTDYFIPIKVGEPLSSACERANVIGSIPEVIRYPSYTLIGGGVYANVTSSGGIGNLPGFFARGRQGCYSRNSQYASRCC